MSKFLTTFAAVSLLSALFVTDSHASKLDRLAVAVGCNEVVDIRLPEANVLGYIARILDNPVSFMGKTDGTAVFPNADDIVIAAAVHVDADAKDDDTRKHGHKIWKFMKRKYGQPIVTDAGWFWHPENSEISQVGVLLLRNGTAIFVDCKL